MLSRAMAFACGSLVISACTNSADTVSSAAASGGAFKTSIVAEFEQPWAMTFLPDGRLLVANDAAPGAVETSKLELCGRVPFFGQTLHAGKFGLGSGRWSSRRRPGGR